MAAGSIFRKKKKIYEGRPPKKYKKVVYEEERDSEPELEEEYSAEEIKKCLK